MGVHALLTAAVADDDYRDLSVDGVSLSASELLGIVDAEAQGLLAEGWRPYDRFPLPAPDFTGVLRTVAALTIGLTLDPHDETHGPRAGRPAVSLEDARQALAHVRESTGRREHPWRDVAEHWWLHESTEIDRLPARIPGPAGRLLLQLRRQPPKSQPRPMVEPDEPPFSAGLPAVHGTLLVLHEFGLACCGVPTAAGDHRTWHWQESGGILWAGCGPANGSTTGVVRAMYELRPRNGGASGAAEPGPVDWNNRPLPFWPHRQCRGDVALDVEPLPLD
ncbi:hypothetical protein GCM10027418_07010 [Mariniluteicoccus endophyticus]